MSDLLSEVPESQFNSSKEKSTKKSIMTEKQESHNTTQQKQESEKSLSIQLP